MRSPFFPPTDLAPCRSRLGRHLECVQWAPELVDTWHFHDHDGTGSQRTDLPAARWRMAFVVLSVLVGISATAVAEVPGAEESQPPAATTEQDALAETDGNGSLAIDSELAAVLSKKFPENVADLKAIERQTRLVLDRVLPATVGLQIGSSAGSGVIVNSEGLILTAGHVAGEPGRDVRVVLADGRRTRAKTLGVNRIVDSGMIQITEKGPWPYAKLAAAGEIKPGQWVVATGHPGGYRPDRSPPVRLGRVLFVNSSVLCTDCTLVGGDSGGPLFNMRGEVVGIHSRIGRKITDNFHVPIETYHKTWERLVSGQVWGGNGPKEQVTRVRPFLGVHLDGRAVRPTIIQVNPGSPADRAGIRVGDVFQTFDGQTVQTRLDLMRQLSATKPRRRVKIEIEREGETVPVELMVLGITRDLPGGMPEELPEIKPAESESPPPKNVDPKDDTPSNGETKRPEREKSPQGEAAPGPSRPDADKEQDPSPGAPLDAACDRMGIELDPVSLRCLVSFVRPDSPAAAARIMPGDVVLRWGAKEIRTIDDLRKALSEHTSGDVEVRVLRRGHEISLRVRVGETRR